MAGQRPFGQSEEESRGNQAVIQGPGSGAASPTFVGGGINKATGNLTPGSTNVQPAPPPQPFVQAEGGTKPTGSDIPPPPPPPPPVPVQAAPPRLSSVSAQSPIAYTPPPPPPAPAPAPQQKSNTSGIFGAILGGLATAAVFCYRTGTKVRMADFSWKNVEDLRLGDEIDLGGYVLSRGESFVPPGKLFEYLGTHVTETHTVFEEGRFVRVEDSLYGKRIDHDGTEVIVHPIVTQFHLMHLETHISTDLTEVDDWKGRNPDDIIAELNNDTDRVARLCAIARSNAADHYQGLRRLERMVESDQ